MLFRSPQGLAQDSPAVGVGRTMAHAATWHSHARIVMRRRGGRGASPALQLQAASQPSCLSSRRVSRGLVPPSPLLHNRKARRVAVDACVAAECVPLALHLSCLFAHTLGVGRRPLLVRRALWRWSTWCKVRLAEDDGRRGVQVRQRGPEGEARAMRTRRLCRRTRVESSKMNSWFTRS